jgi:hypothetical protein
MMLVRLVERWRSSVPGEAANVFLCDPASGSVFVGDAGAQLRAVSQASAGVIAAFAPRAGHRFAHCV